MRFYIALVVVFFSLGKAVDYLASISGLPACVSRQVERGDTERCRVIDR